MGCQGAAGMWGPDEDQAPIMWSIHMRVIRFCDHYEFICILRAAPPGDQHGTRRIASINFKKRSGDDHLSANWACSAGRTTARMLLKVCQVQDYDHENR